MRSIWDKIFAPDDTPEADLTDLELEQAVRELASAAHQVEQMQLSPEHERILRRIQRKLEGREKAGPG